MKWKSRWLTATLAIVGGIGTCGWATGEDGGVFVGDTPSYGSEVQDVGDSMPEESIDYMPQRTIHAGGPSVSQAGRNKPTSYSSGGGRPVARSSRYRQAATGCAAGWANVDNLVWFPQVRTMQPLVTTANAGENPLPGSPGYRVLFGDEIDTGATLGLRVDAGRYFGPSNMFGFGARAQGLMTADSELFVQDNGAGAPSLGRYYFDIRNAPLFNRPDAIELVAGQTAPPGPVPLRTGQIRAQSEFDYIGSEIYGRLVMSRNSQLQVDMLSGFTSAKLEDKLLIDSASFDLTQVAPSVTTYFRDNFETENTFLGGHLGMETRAKHDRWYVSMLTKVHLGNMNQRVFRQGFSQAVAGNQGVNAFPTNAAAAVAGGILNTQNLGNFERDVFTFAPEINLKLGLAVAKNTYLTVGYSFIYWDHVALADDQIDPAVDPFGLIPIPYQIRDDSFFLHGLDLGVTVQY